MNELIARYMENALRYEKLLKSIASMCATNATVDWDDKDASEEFKAISNEIMWGLYEIDTNGTSRKEATE